MLSSIKFTSSRTNRSYFSEWWRTIDRLGLTLLLLSIASGLILSLAASPAASARLGLDDPFYFFFRQLVFVTLGLSGAFFISSLSLAYLSSQQADIPDSLIETVIGSDAESTDDRELDIPQIVTEDEVTLEMMPSIEAVEMNTETEQ